MSRRQLAARLALLVAASPLLAAQSAPPGLVRVSGGKTKLGTPLKEVEQVVLENEELKDFLVAETPRVSVEVEDFFLMVTEVTNEQFAAYVEDVGAKPPLSWWDQEDQKKRQAEFFEEDHKRREALKAEGKRNVKRGVFDPIKTWDKVWRESPWSVPQNLLSVPITRVQYADVEGYCAWAGLRPMTEAEFVRAARGSSDREYPWGDWDDEQQYAVSQLTGKDHPVAVGSFEAGAVDGIFDLAGNVWEWTSSPYMQFDGYRPLKVRTKGRGARTIEGMARFDPTFRVAVGGSFANPSLALRISTRMGMDKTQATDGLGFRCAASMRAGLDVARAILDKEVVLFSLPTSEREREFLPERVLARQRWHSKGGQTKVEGYRIITGYDRTVFLPVESIPESNQKNLARHTTEHGPVVVGIFSTSKAIQEPALEPGSYFVAWRGPGKLPEGVEAPAAEGEESEALQDDEAGAFEEFHKLAGFNPEESRLLLFDAKTGAPRAAIKVDDLRYDRLRSEGGTRVEPWVPLTEEQLEKLEKEGKTPPTPHDTLVYDLAIRGRDRNRGYHFPLKLKIAPGSLDGWK